MCCCKRVSHHRLPVVKRLAAGPREVEPAAEEGGDDGAPDDGVANDSLEVVCRDAAVPH